MKNRLPSAHNAAQLNADSLPKIYLQHLLDAAAEVMCAVDEDGLFRFVSKACSQLWGYEPHEMAGRPITNFIVEEDIESTRDGLVQSKASGHPVYFINRFYSKTGTVVIVHWYGQWNAADGLHYCTAQDGSRIYEMEQRLTRTQRLAKVAGFEFDWINQSYTYTSDTLFPLFGIDKKEHPVFTLDLFWRHIHPDDLKFVKENTLQPAQHYQPGLEYRIVRGDGSIVYIKRFRELIRNEKGELVKTIGTLQDITQRKNAELALIQSGQRLNALIANGSDLIGILDQKARYSYVADNVKHLLGYAPEFFIDKSPLDFIHPDDQQEVVAAMAEVKSKKYITLKPFRFKNAQHEWRWIETKMANFTDDPSINGLIVNSNDITDRKNKDDKIRELSLIAEKTSQAILLTDRHHNIVWVNQAFTDLSEYTLPEVMGKKPQAFFSDEEVTEETHLNIQQKLSENQPVTIEMPCRSKSGNHYWLELQLQPIVDEGGNVLQYLAIGKDITRRKEIDAQLALSQQRFKALVQNGSDLIVIIDERGNFKYISENVQQLLHYSAESMLGKNAFDFIHNDDCELVFGELQRVFTNSHDLKGVQHRFLSGTGEWVWLETKGSNHTANKAIEGIIINSRNITDRVKLQQQLDAELRNRQKEVTTAVINAQEQERSQLGLELHDNVNQILTTVKLYNEMFLSGFEEDKGLIHKSTVYLQQCINEIRSISKRLSAPTLGHISLHDSIQELIESLVLTRQLEIVYQPSNIENLCIGRDMHLSIYRIIQEGLNNIIKYAEAKTAIISIRYWQNLLNVTIYDDGKGFDTGLKRSGIGITNMRTRAENLNGTFSLKSKPGNGCLIKIEFPLECE